jgi:hypothetical protein
MAAQFPFGTSRWQFVGGQWFAVTGTNLPARFFFTVAAHFRNGGRTIDASKGLDQADLEALMAKFPDAVSLNGEEFTLPLVPEGTVIDITPEARVEKAS